MRLANSPKFNKNVVALPEVDGVTWKVDGQEVPSGNLPELKPGEKIAIEAVLNDGVVTSGITHWTFSVPAEKSTETQIVEEPVPLQQNVSSANPLEER